MLTNKKITVLFIIFLAVIFLLPETVFAQATDILGTNDLADAGVNLGSKSLTETIVGIVNIFLGFLGILATLLILYAGFLWMTSNGVVDKIAKAKRILTNGIIGLLIILSSYAITNYIFKEGFNSVFNSGGGNSGGGFTVGVGLGAGALDSHYPIRYAKDVPRNTNIYLTFKEPMNVSMIGDVCSGGPGIDCEANSSFINLWEQGNSTPITGNNLIINYSVDANTGFRTFQINPVNDLGSNTANVTYRMELGDLETQNGSIAFPYTNDYYWSFTTGTEFDFTPPTVVSVRPIDGSTDNPRNSVVQINFSEPINPALATGDTANGFSNIRVINNDDTSGTPIVSGEYKISNQYRTIELITTDFCGANSCGGDVFCLPASDTIVDLVRDFDAIVSDIVADMSDNILDGDDDGVAGGDYAWVFTTTNEIDLTPPTVSNMQNPNDINLDNPIDITFDKELLGSSINSDNIELRGIIPVNYWMRLLGGDTISIRHDRFDPASYYEPVLTSDIKDLRQNCWFPTECNDTINSSCVCNLPTTSGNGVTCTGN